MTRSSSQPNDPPRRLHRWLRYSWLGRLPLIGLLLRARKPKAPPRPPRQAAILNPE